MNDQLALARVIANEIDAEMHRKGYEQGLIDGREKVLREFAEAIASIHARDRVMEVQSSH